MHTAHVTEMEKQSIHITSAQLGSHQQKLNSTQIFGKDFHQTS